MAVKVQVILDERERDLFQRQAALDGMSLSGWLREAGRDRLERGREGGRLRSAEDLDAFFRECDARETGEEPDWEEQRRVIERSRAGGQAPT